MERRVEYLEQRMEKLEDSRDKLDGRPRERECDMVKNEIAIGQVAALHEYEIEGTWELEAKRAKEHRRQRREIKRDIERQRAIIALEIVIAIAMAAAVILVVNALGVGRAAASTERAGTAAADIADAMAAEDPLEAEKIEEALLAQGYFSVAVPMCYEYQDYMRTYCAAYGCPYPLALAVAGVESNFNMDAIGAAGEIGIMQLNPGPDGAYLQELQEATGIDPTTPSGNIAAGCYKLGKWLEEYGDTTKALMAYNMGRSGAERAWAAGVTSTDYTEKVLEAMEGWECTVNAWAGE
jgi:hypothetical protein